MKRKGLAALGWGTGLITEEITMSPAKLWLKNSSSISTTVIDVEIDGSEQDAVDPDHVPIKLKLWWEDGRLEASSCNKATGKPMAHITRILEDNGTMRVVWRSASGREVARHFLRQ